MITRRQALKSALAAAASFALGNSPEAQAAKDPTIEVTLGQFKLPPLPYAYDALEPHIDAKTMEIHHSKHHAAYVTKLNQAMSSLPQYKSASLEEILTRLDSIPEAQRTAVRNHGGGHFNHSLYWKILSPQGGGEPKGELAVEITKTFGKFADFKDQFIKMGLATFGSGWVWLSLDPSKKLVLESTPNQDCPISHHHSPLMGADVWEHAYYLKHQNLRKDYLEDFFNVIHWDAVNTEFVHRTS